MSRRRPTRSRPTCGLWLWRGCAGGVKPLYRLCAFARERDIHIGSAVLSRRCQHKQRPLTERKRDRQASGLASSGQRAVPRALVRSRTLGARAEPKGPKKKLAVDCSTCRYACSDRIIAYLYVYFASMARLHAVRRTRAVTSVESADTTRAMTDSRTLTLGRWRAGPTPTLTLSPPAPRPALQLHATRPVTQGQHNDTDTAHNSTDDTHIHRDRSLSQSRDSPDHRIHHVIHVSRQSHRISIKTPITRNAETARAPLSAVRSPPCVPAGRGVRPTDTHRHWHCTPLPPRRSLTARARVRGSLRQ
jgi:hypothetical protein